MTPDGEDSQWNCVVRAITVASGIPYREVEKLLQLNADKNRCEERTCDCYSYLLEDYFGYERHECSYQHTVQEVADMYQNDKVLMRLDGHLTLSVNGRVVDIFDCTEEPVDVYWVVR